MPYTSSSEVPDYVPKDKKKQWMAVWNSAYHGAKDKGKSDKEAEEQAFREANGVAGPNSKAMKTYQKFIPLVKVDEAKREVGGLVTAEIEDKTGEICHYASTKPYYMAWSDEFVKATDGKSLGNLREMHGLSAAGVAKSLDFRDEEKAIFMTFKVVDDDAWKKVQEGVYTGFSQGGSYVTQWTDKAGKVWYTADPSEVSLVDNPCLGAAHFDFIRADGIKEIRKFKRSDENMSTAAVTSNQPEFVTADGARKIVAEALAKAESDKAVADAELNKVNNTRKFCQEQAEVIIKARGEAEGFKVGSNPDGVTKGLYLSDGEKKVKKGMYEVSFLASIISDFAFLAINQTYEELWEQDSSNLPAELLATLNQMADNFLAMAEEEVKEVLESAAEAGKSEGGEVLTMSTQNAELQKAANKSLADHLKRMADSVTAHHEKVTKLSKDHHDNMHDHVSKCMKILGAEEVDGNAHNASGVNEPANIDPTASGTTNLQHAEKGLTTEEIQKMIAEGVEKGVEAKLAKVKEEVREATMTEIADTLAVALTEEQAADQPVVKTASGVGDRTKVASAPGPVVRVVPVTKVDDVTPNGDVKPEAADVNKALSGDRTEILKMMKGVKPTAIPQSLQANVARLAR